jgi:transposase
VGYKVRGDVETAETLELVVNRSFCNYTSRKLKSNIDDNLLTAYVFVVYGRQHPHKSTVKDVLKDLKEKNINFSQVVEYRTYHCHNEEYSK